MTAYEVNSGRRGPYAPKMADNTAPPGTSCAKTQDLLPC